MSIYLQHSTRTGKQEVDICRAKGRDSKAKDGDNQVCYNESGQNVNSLTHSSSPSLSSPLDLSHIPISLIPPLSLSQYQQDKKKRRIRKGVWKKQKVGWVYFFFIQIQPSTHNVQYLLRSARNVPQFNNYHATWHVSIFFLNTVNPSPFVTCKAMWGPQYWGFFLAASWRHRCFLSVCSCCFGRVWKPANSLKTIVPQELPWRCPNPGEGTCASVGTPLTSQRPGRPRQSHMETPSPWVYACI